MSEHAGTRRRRLYFRPWAYNRQFDSSTKYRLSIGEKPDRQFVTPLRGSDDY
jgi:hypothetical protein